MERYNVKIENSSGERKEAEIDVETTIGNIISSFGNRGWIVTEYYQVFNDSSETDFISTSTD